MSGELKKCNDCGETKPLSEFYWKSDQSSYRYDCKSCSKARSASNKRKRRRRDPVGESKKNRGWYLGSVLRKLGVVDLEILLQQQGSACAVCGTSDPGRRGWMVDHCHKTMRFRGILCGKCNSGLGMFNDNPDVLEQAIAYLRRSANGETV
jgi:hypothetical protein